MRRLSAPRASTAVAVVAAIVAVLAVMAFPGLGFGQTTTSHGGSPSDVYTQELPLDTCLTVGPNTEIAMEQRVTVRVTSNLLVYFSFEWGRLDAHEEGLMHPGLGGELAEPFEWGFPGNNVTTRSTDTVMWSFANVAPGEHRVDMAARLAVAGPMGSGRPSADLNDCALTVFVIPVAE